MSIITRILDLNNKLKFAVIMTRYKDKWIFVRHKERLTWEIPGGHVPIYTTCRDYSKNTTHRFIEIFDFKHFARHFTFDRVSKHELNKELKSYVPVSVVLRVETRNTSEIK